MAVSKCKIIAHLILFHYLQCISNPLYTNFIDYIPQVCVIYEHLLIRVGGEIELFIRIILKINYPPLRQPPLYSISSFLAYIFIPKIITTKNAQLISRFPSTINYIPACPSHLFFFSTGPLALEGLSSAAPHAFADR